MDVIEGKGFPVVIVTLVLLGLTMGGCATSIKYLYDTKTSFPEQKSYTWAPSSPAYRQDPLLETNVQALADQLLAQKGLTRTSEKPDLVISMSYEFESSLYQYGYQLRSLTLNVYKNRSDKPQAEPKESVWRGTASGCINTDAASGDLAQAVHGILSHFPPK